MNTPPATAGAATGATGAGASSATGASSTTSSAASSSPAENPSAFSGVRAVKASQVAVNLAPKTCPIVNVFSGKTNNPDSTKSGNIAGSSKLAGSTTVPASNLQHVTAGSLAWA